MRTSRSTRAIRRIAGSFALVAAAGWLFVPPARADDDAHAVVNLRAVSIQDVQGWISQLNDDSFTVRQAAASRLLAAGINAREPLLQIVDAPDPETRAAARRLVAQIDRSEFHRQLEAFAADIDGRRGLTLPGWDQYRELVGGDPAARALFVEMQRHEAPLMSAVFGGSAQPPEQLWEERVLKLVQWQVAAGARGSVFNSQASTPPLGSCAAMLFLGAVSQVSVSDRGAMYVEGLIGRPPIRESLQAAAPHDALRRLVVAWILHCPNTNEHILRQRLNLMQSIDLKEALPLALDVAGGDPQYARVQPFVRAAAVLAIGQLGGPEHVEHLEPLLEDTSVCMPGQVRVPGQAPPPNIEVRDVALVVMLQLSGQRPADYGYLHARNEPGQMFQLPTLHSESKQRRSEAIAKWRAWRAAQPKKGVRNPPVVGGTDPNHDQKGS